MSQHGGHQSGPALPPSRSHSRQPSQHGFSLPSICEHEQDPSSLPQQEHFSTLSTMGARHGRTKSRNGTTLEGGAPSDFLYTSGGGAGFTEDAPNTSTASQATNSAPKQGLNRPRPPSIVLYSAQQQQQQQQQAPPLHCNTDTRASASVPLSPRSDHDITSEGGTDECGSVVYHPSRQQAAVWSTSQAVDPPTRGSMVVMGGQATASDLQWACTSPHTDTTSLTSPHAATPGGGLAAGHRISAPGSNTTGSAPLGSTFHSSGAATPPPVPTTYVVHHGASSPGSGVASPAAAPHHTTGTAAHTLARNAAHPSYSSDTNLATLSARASGGEGVPHPGDSMSACTSPRGVSMHAVPTPRALGNTPRGSTTHASHASHHHNRTSSVDISLAPPPTALGMPATTRGLTPGDTPTHASPHPIASPRAPALVPSATSLTEDTYDPYPTDPYPTAMDWNSVPVSPATTAAAAAAERSAGEAAQPRSAADADGREVDGSIAHVFMTHNPLSHMFALQSGSVGRGFAGVHQLPSAPASHAGSNAGSVVSMRTVEEHESEGGVLSGRVTAVMEDESGEAAAAEQSSEAGRSGDPRGLTPEEMAEKEAAAAMHAEREQEERDALVREDEADRVALAFGCGFGAAFGGLGSGLGSAARVSRQSGTHPTTPPGNGGDGAAQYTVTHNSLYAHAGGAQDAGGGAHAGVRGGSPVGSHVAPPLPLISEAKFTWHRTLDMLWDCLSLALFLLALILDIVSLAAFAAADCEAAWWVPTIVFIIAHTAFMGLVLLVHSQWADWCLRGFKRVVFSPECENLRKPWCAGRPARFALFIPQCLVILITFSMGTMITFFVLLGILIIAFASVPLLDLSTAAATLWPMQDKKRFRSQDLLFLENFKLARYSLQAVLQSLPQIILLAIALSKLGPINGDPKEVPQCGAPSGVVIAALAIASLNVLDKLFQSGVQVKHMVGRHGLSGVRGLGQNIIDLITIQGSHRVPLPVMDITLAQMLRSASDFVVGADVDDTPGPPTAQLSRHSPPGRSASDEIHTRPPLQIAVANSASSEDTLGAQVQGSSPESASRSGSGPLTGLNTGQGQGSPSTGQEEGSPPPAEQGAPGAEPAPAATPSPEPRSGHRSGRLGRLHMLRGSLSSPRAIANLRLVRNGPDLARVLQGRGDELEERAVYEIRPSAVAGPEQRGFSGLTHLWSRDQPSNTVPLVPSLLLPTRGGRLEPNQMATVVREAIARYPHHAITRWAMESPQGANQGIADIMAGGLRRFTALQNLTICKCKLGGHGFPKVARLLQSHSQLTDLRFEHVHMDKIATSGLAELVRNTKNITRLDLAHCTFPKNHPDAFASILQALAQNTSLNLLTLVGNGIDAAGIHALTEALSRNTSLKLLDLSSNPQLSSPPCVSALVGLLRSVAQRHEVNQGDAVQAATPLRLVLTIKDLGFAGALQLVNELGVQQQQELAKRGQPMPPCTIVSHGPAPPTCLRVSGLPLWLVAGGAEGRAAIEALMPTVTPPTTATNSTLRPPPMSPVREADPGADQPSSRSNSHTSAPHSPTQHTPSGAAASPAAAFAPNQASQYTNTLFTPASEAHASNSMDGDGDDEGIHAEQGAASAHPLPKLVNPCELVLVCGGVDNLSLVGVLCSCHRVVGPYLSSLDLSGLSVCDRGAKLMGEMVLHTPNLHSASLAQCNVTDEGAEPLLESLAKRFFLPTNTPVLSFNISQNTLGDGVAAKLVHLALASAQARHAAAVQAIVAIARETGCSPNAASAAAASAANAAAAPPGSLGPVESESVTRVRELGVKMKQQLRLMMLDNQYPMSMEALRSLQRAMPKASAQLSAANVAAEATMHLQQEPPPPHARHSHAFQADNRSSAGSEANAMAGMPTTPTSPGIYVDPATRALFASYTREQVIGVTLRAANMLLASMPPCPPAFVLELVHRPPGVPPPFGQPQQQPTLPRPPTAQVPPRPPGQALSVRPTPSTPTLDPSQPPTPTPGTTTPSPSPTPTLAQHHPRFHMPSSHGAPNARRAAGSGAPTPPSHVHTSAADVVHRASDLCMEIVAPPSRTHAHARHRRNVSASDAVALTVVGDEGGRGEPTVQATSGPNAQPHQRRRVSDAPFRRTSDRLPLRHVSEALPAPTAPTAPSRPHHSRNVSATESQVQATAAVISGALGDGDGDWAQGGLALVGLGPTPGHSRQASGTHPAVSRGHSRTFSDASDGENTCGVCFDNPSNLLLRTCGHKICVQCYRYMVRPGHAPTARCPFCRSLIVGFDYRLASDQALLWH